jgi:hypothetical protein
MQQDVRATLIIQDEPKALADIEPFDTAMNGSWTVRHYFRHTGLSHLTGLGPDIRRLDVARHVDGHK